jgi:two-component system sensor histidine kinase SenX3
VNKGRQRLPWESVVREMPTIDHVVAWKRSRQVQDAVVAPLNELPPALIDSLSALDVATAVVGFGDRLLFASESARAMGIVRQERLFGEELLSLVRQARRGNQVLEAAIELPRGPLGAGRRDLAVRAAPIRGTEPTEGLVLLLVQDDSESRLLDAVRRDFVVNVSHELKTPIGALMLLAEAVMSAKDEPMSVEKFASSMQREAQRLSNLVQEIIDLSRLQVNDPLARAMLVDIDDVVADSIDRSQMSAQVADITLVCGGTEGLKVMGDYEQLTKALRNLIDNAISYSSPKTRVAVGVKRVDDIAEISVTDQGIGIPKDSLDRVFERFYRIDPARSRVTGGTGLGLSIVKHVVANHGGEVKVWSIEGSGSTFTLRLPLANQQEATS